MKKIMVVDDEPIITMTLTSLLEMMLECEVVVYNDPLLALEDAYLKTRQLDMIISDFMMPGLDGFEFLKAAQRLHPTCLAILLTGYADKNNAIKCINELNLYYYLEKPWQNDDLLKVINNAFEALRLEMALGDKVLELEKANLEISKLYELLKSDFESAVDEKHTLQNHLLQRTLDMQKILNYVDQGFLIVEKDLRVYPEFSEKCLEFFMKDIKGLDFPKLIYPDQEDEGDFLRNILLDLMSQDQNSVQILMPLLPDEVLISGRPISMSFTRLLDQHQKNDHAYFVTLTDISDRKALEFDLEEERQVLQMIVEAYGNASEIKEVIRDYHFFIERTLPNLMTSHLPNTELMSAVFRQVHTFKGMFGQLNLVHSAARLHEIESLMSMNMEAVDLIKTIRFQEVMTEDLRILEKHLGEAFLNLADEVVVEKEKLLALEKDLIRDFSGQILEDLLCKIHALRYKPLAELFRQYVPYVARLSELMNKPMAEMEIRGSMALVDHDIYRDFSKSLIHVIRNMMDHGIETIEVREATSKSYLGHISIQIIEGKDELVLLIENDGQKIDVEALKARAAQEGIDTRGMSEGDLLMLIFESGISTRDVISQMSGRGMGLAAVRYEVQRLGGRIMMESTDDYTRYIFKLPYYKGVPPKTQLSRHMIQSLEMYLQQYVDHLEISEVSEVPSPGLIGAQMALHGIYDCKISLFMANETLKSFMMRGGLQDTLEYKVETIKEILNTVMGNGLQMMPGAEQYVELGVPISINPEDIPKDIQLFSIGENSIYMGIEM